MQTSSNSCKTREGNQTGNLGAETQSCRCTKVEHSRLVVAHPGMIPLKNLCLHSNEVFGIMVN